MIPDPAINHIMESQYPVSAFLFSFCIFILYLYFHSVFVFVFGKQPGPNNQSQPGKSVFCFFYMVTKKILDSTGKDENECIDNVYTKRDIQNTEIGIKLSGLNWQR